MGKGKRVTEGEIEEMVRMRRQGYSMEAIAESTGRHRHTVRAYLEERQAQHLADEARREVMIQELRQHLDELSHFGTSLVEQLRVPDSPHEIRDAVAVLYSLRSGENKLLFDSLREHTRETSWQTFYEWEKAWDRCILALAHLRRKVGELVEKLVEEDTGLLSSPSEDDVHRAKEATAMKEVKMDLLDVLMASVGKDAPIKRITDGIIHLLWRHILHPDEEFPIVETIPRADGRIDITFGKDRFTNYLIVREQSLADKVMGICKSVAEKLRGDLTESVVKEIATMQARIEEFREVLSPLRLRPVLLRSRCSLCPA